MSNRPISPAPRELRQTQVLLFAAAAVPGLLLTATGIVSLAMHRFTSDVVLGVLTLAFAMWVVVGGLAGWLLVRRSERITRLQHDFVSSVSHELRTPLTGIRMLVETLQQQRADPEQRERCLELLDGETARLVSIVEEVLAFGRLSAGQTKVFPARESVDEVVDAALDRFEALRVQGAHEVLRVIEPGLFVRADRRALEQVLLNLLENAFKYGGERGRIWIRAGRDTRLRQLRGEVQIAVEDEGPGVPLPLRRKIFQEFYRGEDEQTQSKPGTGLGLAIARRLVVAQKGSIRCEPRPGGGSRFIVTLPPAAHA
jgi:two-component system phosphate regulon sensor histidine kinase PhoR